MMLTKTKAIRKPSISCLVCRPLPGESRTWTACCECEPCDDDLESVVPATGSAIVASLPVRRTVLTRSALCALSRSKASDRWLKVRSDRGQTMSTSRCTWTDENRS
jgi:hypothetical protein